MLRDGLLKVDATLQGDETLMLEVRVKSGWLGRFLDPRVELYGSECMDRQTFERGVDGLRFLNRRSLHGGQLQAEIPQLHQTRGL